MAAAPSEPSPPPADDTEAEPPQAADPRAGTFIKAISAAALAAIFEGLPHPGSDREAFDRERRTKPVKELHGYWFHRKPRALSAAEGKELSRLLSTPGTYLEFSGEKKCGGFHPNYAVEWKQGEKLYRALICFSCHEIKLFGPGIETRHDLESDTYYEIVKLLGGHDLLPPL